MKMVFRLNIQGGRAVIINNRKRDLSLYSGIEFYAKANQQLVGIFVIKDTNRQTNDKHDRWYALFEVGTKWKKYQIAFIDMSMAQRYARKRPGGDGVLSLHMVEHFEIGLTSNQNMLGTSGVMWIDEVKFF
jgi:hypothetical protein